MLRPTLALAAKSGGESSADVPGDSLLRGLSFTNKKEPVTVTADALEFDYRARVLVYRGKVTATQGDMKLSSDVLTLKLEAKTANRLESVIAEGHVELVKGQRTANADRAEYDQGNRTIVLTNNAVLRDGPNQVSGDQVTVYLDDERTVIQGGDRRVQALLFPQGTAAVAPTPAAPKGDGRDGAEEKHHHHRERSSPQSPSPTLAPSSTPPTDQP